MPNQLYFSGHKIWDFNLTPCLTQTRGFNACAPGQLISKEFTLYWTGHSSCLAFCLQTQQKCQQSCQQDVPTANFIILAFCYPTTQEINPPHVREHLHLLILHLPKTCPLPLCLLLSLIPHLPVITQLSSKLLPSFSAVIPKYADQQKQCFLSLLVQFWGGSLLHFGFWYYKADPGAKVRITFWMCHQNKSYNLILLSWTL